MRSWAGPALAALAGVAGAVASPLSATSRGAAWNEWVVALVVAVYAGVSLLILLHAPRHPIARLMMLATVVWGLGEGLLGLAVNRLEDDAGDRPAALAAVLGGAGRGLGWLLLVLWLPLRFPDGRPAGMLRRQRLGDLVAGTTLALFTAVQLFSPRQMDLRVADVDNPVGLPHDLERATQAAAGLALLLAVVAIGLAVSCLAHRWRHGSAIGRQQLLWFMVAFAPPVLLFVLSIWDLAQPWMFGLATLPVPVAVGVAVLQRRLYDVQLVLNRSVTYAALSVVIAGLYALTVGGVGALLRSRGAPWLPWVAAGVVAVSFAPVREALQQAANKLTYGQWSRPQEVLAGVGRRLGDATDVPGLLRTLADELRSSLGLWFVAIVDADGHTLAVSGSPDAESDEMPLVAYGSGVGLLRWGGPRLRDADRVLLRGVANQLGAVLHSSQLLGQLRASQERLVIAREEERKRLRRDLHDGLGPTLAGLTLRVDTLRNKLADRTVDADGALLGLREEIQGTVADVRRVVEGLRPPAIDELGLAEALRRLAGRLGGPDRMDIPLIEVVVTEPLPALPAAVEVAAYRIVQEALTNVLRHADARCVAILLALRRSMLVVEVRDDGRGAAVARPDGVGLSSMRERAEEIGGSLTITTEAGAGTSVVARLPVTGVSS